MAESAGSGLTPAQQRTSATWLWPLLLVVLGAVAYSTSLGGVFLFDDDVRIVGDHSIRSLWPAGPLLGDTSRPVLKLTLALNYAAGGLDVTGYHLVNAVIHLLAALVLLGVLRRTLWLPCVGFPVPSANRTAFAAAALWVVHPLHTQAVTYVIQRAESLMGLCYLLTLYAALRGAGERASRLWSLAAVWACALGMGTKEVMATAPVVVLLYDGLLLRRSVGSALRARPGMYLGLGACWGMLGLAGLEQVAESAGPDPVAASTYLLSQPAVLLHYLGLALWPDPLCLDYGWPAVTSWREAVVPGMVVCVLVAAVFLSLARRRPAAFLGLWFFAILAPTSSFVPIRDLAFEHRMYLPLASVCMAVVLLVRWVIARTGGGLALASLLGFIAVGCLTLRTLLRQQDYRSARRMWESVVAAAPLNYRGHSNLALALGAEGDVEGAIQHYRRSVDLWPDFTAGYNNLGTLLVSQGQPAAARSQFEQALQRNAQYAPAHYNLFRLLQAQGRSQEAFGHLEQAVASNPTIPKPLATLARLLATHDNPTIRDETRARQLAEQAVELTLRQDAALLETLSLTLAAAGETDRALLTLQEACERARETGPPALVERLEEQLLRVGRGR